MRRRCGETRGRGDAEARGCGDAGARRRGEAEGGVEGLGNPDNDFD